MAAKIGMSSLSWHHSLFIIFAAVEPLTQKKRRRFATWEDEYMKPQEGQEEKERKSEVEKRR